MISRKLIKLLKRDLNIRFCFKCGEWTEILQISRPMIGCTVDHCSKCRTVYDHSTDKFLEERLLEKLKILRTGIKSEGDIS
jgi:hypothetical protein